MSVLLLAACTANGPVAMSPTDTTQVFRVPIAPTQVYGRIYDRLNACHLVHNIFAPGQIVGGVDRDGQHARIYFANDKLALWGAEIEAVDGGSKVTTHIGKDAPSDRYHSLLRGWAEGRRPPPAGETDC